MGASTAIPAKYVPVLAMYASAILLQWQERKKEAIDMFIIADGRLFDIAGADDFQENFRKIERVGIM